ncbi:MATE family efflux transporter [Flavobacterium pallidum]|uniref:Multidrug export protein MepA n=1 Tax=Flavobacterium pallidum TaxID=2172098 RepID=A0A2S1SF07_9FLAO|nr:MATE family efflux transporter [Flavobacterium pallidum]AWI24996.1 MATE family efflux transporter [Flavobacterium pallidum]
MTVSKHDLGTQSVRKLILGQAVPASVGILFMTVNLLIDTIFVGRWLGSLAIAALTVVTPIAFLISSLGLAIGVGGTSVISRAFGADDEKTARRAFAHQIMLTLLLSTALVACGLIFSEDMLRLFGAKGNILEPAKIFLYPILLAAPLQAFLTMGNSVMRAEDKAGRAMTTMIIASIANILLDIIFIKLLNWEIFGAALATAISFAMAFIYMLWCFIAEGKLRLRWTDFAPKWKMIGEITSLSGSTFARQGIISILSVLLNHTLFEHGGDHAVTVYGIVSKMLMFALFPVNGIVEGFLPIAGYNYGAKKFSRVKDAIAVSIKYACGVALIIYTGILIFASPIVSLFTTDNTVIADAPNALRWIFAASPVIAVQLIGAAYFQAAGKALKALLLTLSKQGFFLIPLILILPEFFGIFGVWFSFPIADVLSTTLTAIFLKKEINTGLK